MARKKTPGGKASTKAAAGKKKSLRKQIEELRKAGIIDPPGQQILDWDICVDSICPALSSAIGDEYYKRQLLEEAEANHTAALENLNYWVNQYETNNCTC